VPDDFVPRRSSRLAKKRTGALSAEVRQVQVNLMRRLGLVADQETLRQEALDEYSRLFNKPLSQAHFAALVVLFGSKTLKCDCACSV
jgi:hypothetical protein